MVEDPQVKIPMVKMENIRSLGASCVVPLHESLTIHGQSLSSIPVTVPQHHFAISVRVDMKENSSSRGIIPDIQLCLAAGNFDHRGGGRAREPQYQLPDVPYQECKSLQLG